MRIAAGIALGSLLWILSPVYADTPKTWKAIDLLPLTCAQAWVEAGKNYQNMLSIVKTLARVSLVNRELTFPDTREAGSEAGKAIAADCKADPDSLLFAIVDKHVRRIGEAANKPPTSNK
jgi:hypothetical protein